MPKKPKGWNAVIDLGMRRQGIVPVVLPDDKEEREAAIVRIFQEALRELDLTDFEIKGVIQNAQDDFDFKIKLENGERDLELTEFAPLKPRERFDTATNILNTGVTADALTTPINRKSDHYRGYAGVGLILLVYVTHYAFRPSDEIFDLVDIGLRDNPPVFERVFFLAPESIRSGYPRVLFPRQSRPLSPDEITRMRRSWFANGDLSQEFDD